MNKDGRENETRSFHFYFWESRVIGLKFEEKRKLKVTRKKHVDMARSMEPLVVGRVIGDVVDMFTPATEMTVHYGTKQVANGCEIKPSASADKPSVQIHASAPASSNLYTLVRTELSRQTFYFNSLFLFFVSLILNASFFLFFSFCLLLQAKA